MFNTGKLFHYYPFMEKNQKEIKKIGINLLVEYYSHRYSSLAIKLYARLIYFALQEVKESERLV